MAALRRGIAHYQDGSANTQQSDADFVDPMSGARFTPPPVATTPAAPSGFAQIFSGDWAGAARNPESSPFASSIAAFLDQQSKLKRAADVATPPSPLEYLTTMFGGTNIDWGDLGKRANTAKVLGDPLIQRHLAIDPEKLAIAEKNPHGYAAEVQDPEFRQAIEHAVKTYDDVMTRGVTHPDGTKKTPLNPAKTAKTANELGVPPAAAHAALEPHEYTREEFRNAVRGMPLQAVQLLFGHQLAQTRTPQQQAFNDYLKELRAPVEKAAAEHNAAKAAGDEKKRKEWEKEHSQALKYYQQELGKLLKGVPLYQQQPVVE